MICRLCAPALIIVFAFPVARVGSQPGKQNESPETVARAYFLALKQHKIDDCAKAMHPEEIKRFRGILSGVIDSAAQKGEEKQLLAIFGVASVEELHKLNDRQFFAAFYLGATRAAPQLKQMMAEAEFQTLGQVMEGKNTAHVVYRMEMTADGTKISKVSVISLQRTESGWGVMLNAEIEAMAKGLKKQFGGQ
jgi:hypothetical protein